jgi:16S rRNA G966 N2-methylase RsmD
MKHKNYDSRKNRRRTRRPSTRRPSIHGDIAKPSAPRKTRRNTKYYKKIVQQLQPNETPETIQKEFDKLSGLSCTEIKKANGRSRLGNKIVDAYTLIERLHTKGHQNVSFYEFWENRHKYAKKNYVKKMIDFYKKRKVSEVQKYKYIYNLYFSSIMIFKPIMAMELYCRVKATRVLDFTMGWGGRLVGACALNLTSYIGIDLNKNLKKPYHEMQEFLASQPDVQTEIDIRFQDCLTVDYSKMVYDTVFTSPPYYNLETYRSSECNYLSKEEWNEKFYKPIMEKTFRYLQPGGSYCLNVPTEIYDDVCVPVLGKSHQRVLLKKGDRGLQPSNKEKYHEFIYIWKK